MSPTTYYYKPSNNYISQKHDTYCHFGPTANKLLGESLCRTLGRKICNPIQRPDRKPNLMGLTKNWVGNSLAFQEPYQELCREPYQEQESLSGTLLGTMLQFQEPLSGKFGNHVGTLSLSWTLLSGTLSAFGNPYWEPCWEPCWPSGIFNRSTKWPSWIFKISLVLHKVAKWKL